MPVMDAEASQAAPIHAYPESPDDQQRMHEHIFVSDEALHDTCTLWINTIDRMRKRRRILHQRPSHGTHGMAVMRANA
jgi:hypothetical protein